jgi:positive regulator of sigma E activity
MNGLGEIGASSFDSYEGIRIVIPGLVTFAAGSAAFMTIAPEQGEAIFDNPVLSLIAALTIGLMLYYLDVPARAASYTEHQPTDYLEKKYPHVNPSELLTAYLLALNTKMPANIRNRSLYMGSMYRIGLEMILALALATATVFAASVFDYGMERAVVGSGGRQIAAIVLLCSFLLAVLMNRGYQRKSAARSRSVADRLNVAAFNDLRDRSMWIYAVGILLLLTPNLSVAARALPRVAERWIVVLGLAICVAYWAQRYVRGDTIEANNPRERRPLSSASAGALFLAPLVITLLIYAPGERSVLPSVGHIVGWTAAAGLVVLSIVVRGHERKLHGTYRGQTRWLKENPDAMEEVLPSPPKRPTNPRS